MRERKASTLAAEQLYHERGFAARVGGGARPALVVVDMTNAFTQQGYRCSCDSDEAVGHTVRLLDACRARALPIAFTGIAYSSSDAQEGGFLVSKMPALTELVAGSPACELDPRLCRRDSEVLILKAYASAFFGTALAPWLVVRNVDTLIVAGVSTSGCVRATVVDAVQHGFRVLVAGEAVADRAPGPHRSALFDMDSKYADVMTTAALCDYVGGLALTN